MAVRRDAIFGILSKLNDKCSWLKTTGASLCMLFLILNANAFGAESVIRVNLDAALNQLDPIWTTSSLFTEGC